MSKMMARCVGLTPAAPSRTNCRQLGAEQPHRAGRQAVGAVIIFRVLPDRLEIGAKDEGRAVDEKDMAAGADGFMREGHRASSKGCGALSSRERMERGENSPDPARWIPPADSAKVKGPRAAEAGEASGDRHICIVDTRVFDVPQNRQSAIIEGSSAITVARAKKIAPLGRAGRSEAS